MGRLSIANNTFQSAPGFISRGNNNFRPDIWDDQGFNPPPASSAGGTPTLTEITTQLLFQSAPGFISRGNALIDRLIWNPSGFNPPPASSAGGTPEPFAIRP